MPPWLGASKRGHGLRLQSATTFVFRSGLWTRRWQGLGCIHVHEEGKWALIVGRSAGRNRVVRLDFTKHQQRLRKERRLALELFSLASGGGVESLLSDNPKKVS